MSGRVKGAAVREFLVYFQQRWGRAELAARLGRMPPAAQQVFDLDHAAFGVLPSTWYDGEVARALLDCLLADVPEPELSRLIDEATLQMMRANLGGYYKQFFVRILLNPQRYVRHCQKLWNLHFDSGELDVREEGPRCLLWQIRGWRSYHPILHRMVLASEPAVFGAMGCRNVRATRVEPAPGVQAAHRIQWD